MLDVHSVGAPDEWVLKPRHNPGSRFSADGGWCDAGEKAGIHAAVTGAPLRSLSMTRIDMDTLPAPDRTWMRRHWLIVLVAIVVATVAYLGGIGWVAQRLQRDIAQTLQATPAIGDRQNRD